MIEEDSTYMSPVMLEAARRILHSATELYPRDDPNYTPELNEYGEPVRLEDSVFRCLKGVHKGLFGWGGHGSPDQLSVARATIHALAEIFDAEKEPLTLGIEVANLLALRGTIYAEDTASLEDRKYLIRDLASTVAGEAQAWIVNSM